MPFFMHLHGLQIFSNNCLCISFRLNIFSMTMNSRLILFSTPPIRVEFYSGLL